MNPTPDVDNSSFSVVQHGLFVIQNHDAIIAVYNLKILPLRRLQLKIATAGSSLIELLTRQSIAPPIQ